MRVKPLFIQSSNEPAPIDLVYELVIPLVDESGYCGLFCLLMAPKYLKIRRINRIRSYRSSISMIENFKPDTDTVWGADIKICIPQ
jgi:hypothetical protein